MYVYHYGLYHLAGAEETFCDSEVTADCPDVVSVNN